MVWWKVLRNTWIVFLLSGLWHGASWTFVAWGALHAVFLTFGFLRRKLLPQRKDKSGVARVASILVVYTGVVLAWVLFRAGDIATLRKFLGVLCSGDWSVSSIALCAGCGPLVFANCLLAVGLLAGSYLMPRDCRIQSQLGRFVFSVACLATIVFLAMPSGGEFIYFRF